MLKKNNGHGVHTAGQIFDLSGKKFVLDFGDEMFEGLGVLNVYTFPVFLFEQNTWRTKICPVPRAACRPLLFECRRQVG